MTKNTKITLFFVVLTLLYIGSYAYLRHHHVFFHRCTHSGNQKALNFIYLDAPFPQTIVEKNRQSVFITYTVYLPLSSLEGAMHRHDLLPSSCPWN